MSGLLKRLFGSSSATPQSDAAERAIEAKSEISSGSSHQEETKKPWWTRLSQGLSRSSEKIGSGLTSLFDKKKLDDATLEELEDFLIQCDLGLESAARFVSELRATRFNKDVSSEEVRAFLKEKIADALAPCVAPLTLLQEKKPCVVLVVGVNGVGKTTTIGKIASKAVQEGKNVMLAAGDVFRAAAVEQLQIWGERIGAPVFTRPQGFDVAALAYESLKAAQEREVDVLFIDTAGRLHNKADLMAELKKTIRVLKKLDVSAPHATLLVLDATTGQNALSQVQIFLEEADVTGLVMTKLDGTARGGVLVAIAERFGLPIHFIGVGESVEDLVAFSAEDFACALVGDEKKA